MNKAKIFVADDDQDDWFILQDAMQAIGVNDVIEFYINGEKLLTQLESITSKKELPNLVILDLNMPRMSGTEVLQRIKQNKLLNQIPVIIYSTSVNSFEKKKCLELGAFDYVTKPVSSQENIAIARLFETFIKTNAG